MLICRCMSSTSALAGINILQAICSSVATLVVFFSSLNLDSLYSPEFHCITVVCNAVKSKCLTVSVSGLVGSHRLLRHAVLILRIYYAMRTKRHTETKVLRIPPELCMTYFDSFHTMPNRPSDMFIVLKYRTPRPPHSYSHPQP